MAGKKYLSDYILEERVRPGSGHIRTEAVYRGARYRFTADGETLKKTKRLFSSLSVLAAVSFAAPMCVNAPSARFWYVILPFAGMVFPVFFLLASLYRLLTAGEWVTREHRDKLEKRFPPSALFLMIFSALALIGFAVYLFSGKPSPLDWLYPLSEIAVFLSSLILFLRRDALKMEKIPTE